MTDEKDAAVLESAKELVSNYEKRVPKLTDILSTSYNILVKELGAKKTPTEVQVVGYNSIDKKLIVLNASKLYQIEDKNIIKSIDDVKTSKSRRIGNTKKK
jgi:hypothetical protein